MSATRTFSSQETVKTCQFGCQKSDQPSQWIETEVRLYCRRVTQELTLCLVGSIRHQTDSSAGSFLTPSPPEHSPQSAPDYTREDPSTDACSSTDVQEAIGSRADGELELLDRITARSYFDQRNMRRDGDSAQQIRVRMVSVHNLAHL
jgi:hypothetical protein